jgi:hypothetical protein
MEIWLKWKSTCFASMKSQVQTPHPLKNVYVFRYVYVYLYIHTFIQIYVHVCVHTCTYIGKGGGIDVIYVGKPLVSPGEFDINQHAYSSEKS